MAHVRSEFLSLIQVYIIIYIFHKYLKILNTHFYTFYYRNRCCRIKLRNIRPHPPNTKWKFGSLCKEQGVLLLLLKDDLRDGPRHVYYTFCCDTGLLVGSFKTICAPKCLSPEPRKITNLLQPQSFQLQF